MTKQTSLFAPGVKLKPITGSGKGLTIDDMYKAVSSIKANSRSMQPAYSQTEMVYFIMADGAWWTPRRLRAELLKLCGEDAEAITSRIRELRQRGVHVESRRCEGGNGKAHEYRMVL